jgi:hypothetical protein
MSTEDLLWSLLRSETYAGATHSRSPERTVRRAVVGSASPDDIHTEAIGDTDSDDDDDDWLPRPPPVASPRRQARFAVPPSPAYSIPDAPPARRVERSPRELAEVTLRDRFSRVLGDLERDLVAAGVRRKEAPRSGVEAPPAQHRRFHLYDDPTRHADTWIYRWHPYAMPAPPAFGHDVNSLRRPPTGAPAAPPIPAAPPLSVASSAAARHDDVAGEPHAAADMLDGPWLPRWQPAPSRDAVAEATERLLFVEADLLFARRATRTALRTWAFGEDRRPMVRRMRAALRHWSNRGLSCAWATWRSHAVSRAARHRHIAARMLTARASALHNAWVALRLETLRIGRSRLRAACTVRLHSRLQRALRTWRAALQVRRGDLEAALLLTHTFRKWTLMVQTAMLSRLMLREAFAELGSLGPSMDSARGLG